MTRSVSQYKSYVRCGEAYRLERTVTPRPVRMPAAWTAVGSALHEAYTLWEYRNREGGDLADTFGEQYEIEIDRLKEEQPNLNLWNKRPNIASVSRDIELYLELGKKQAASYEAHCRIADWKIYQFDIDDGELPALETEFEVTFGSVVVRGAWDSLLVWPDGSITVRDLKSGNKEDGGIQLGTYAVAAKKAFDLDITKGEFWYTKRGVGEWYHLERYTEEYLTDQYEKLDLAINSEIFLPRPGDTCTFCGVKPNCREKGWL